MKMNLNRQSVGSLLVGLCIAQAAAADLLKPGDPVLAIGRDLISNSSYPGAETPAMGIDSNPATKYLNFGGANSGFIVQPGAGAYAVKSFVITTANDAEERDPVTWQLAGSNATLTSTNNSAGTNESWTVLGSGTVTLPAARLTAGLAVTVTNSTEYSAYRLVFPTLKGGTTVPMQVADVQFYTEANGAGDALLFEGDLVLAVQLPRGSSGYPALEGPSRAIDGDPASKYLNQGKLNTGLIVTPSSGFSRITSMVLTTANDSESRDPASYELFGTTGFVLSTDNSSGEAESWTPIASGALALPSARSTAADPIPVTTAVNYRAYKLIFPTLKDPDAVDATSMQIGEVQFQGDLFDPPQGDSLIAQGDLAVAINVNLGNRSAYNANEGPTNALDGVTTTKYLNQGGVNSGFIVTPASGASVLKSFTITTANDAADRDPMGWELAGSNDTIASAEHSFGTAENWTLIASGTVALPAARQTVGPVVPVANDASYSSYRLVFTSLKGGILMQIADVQFYPDDAGLGTPILAVGDAVVAIQLEGSRSRHNVGESAQHAVDGSANSKYLNQGGENSGLIVMPSAPRTIVQRFSITTANDADNRDPASWELYGSMDAVASPGNSTGTNESWTLIDSGTLTLPTARLALSDSVLVQNAAAYRSYKMLFPTIRDAAAGNLLQFAELQLRGTIVEAAPAGLLATGDAVRAVNKRRQSNSAYPVAESPASALDANSATKYLNNGGAYSGFIVTPAIGSTPVLSLRLVTANDAPERDPASYQLFGTDEAITSVDNSSGLAENWVLIAEGTLTLPDTRLTAGDVVPIANSTPWQSYRLVFPTLRVAGTALMQVADVQFYRDTAGTSPILGATDAILAVQTPQLLSRYPANENPGRLIDGNISSKHLNFGAAESGFIVTPAAGSTVVGGLVLKTANDAPDRDPASYELYGTTDAITSADNGDGLAENWTLISSGPASLPWARLATGGTITFNNTTAYTSYKLVFPTLRAIPNAAPNSMQLAEVQLFGAAEPSGFQVLQGGFDVGTGQVTLRWESQAGADYVIAYSTDLVDWSGRVAGTVPSGGTTTEHTFATPAAASAVFFRVLRQ